MLNMVFVQALDTFLRWSISKFEAVGSTVNLRKHKHNTFSIVQYFLILCSVFIVFFYTNVLAYILLCVKIYKFQVRQKIDSFQWDKLREKWKYIKALLILLITWEFCVRLRKIYMERWNILHCKEKLIKPFDKNQGDFIYLIYYKIWMKKLH